MALEADSNKLKQPGVDCVPEAALLARIADQEAELETLRTLKGNDRLIDALFERNPNPIIFTDARGVPIRMNRAVIDLMGVAPPPDYSMFEDPVFARLGLLEAVKQLQQGKTVCLESFRYNPREVAASLPDNPLQLRFVAFPLHNSDGSIRSHVVILEDVTAQVKAEEALQRQKHFLQTVLDALHDAVFVVEVETSNIVEANRTACDMFGYNHADLLQLSLRDLSDQHPALDLEGVRKYFDDAFDYGPQTFEWLGKRNDGSKLWVEVSVRFTRFNGLGRFVVAIRDISERKQFTEALAESERKFHTLFDGIADAVLLVDIQSGNILEVNRATYPMYGYTRQELIGQHIEIISAEPDKTRQTLRELPKRIVLRYHRKKDGSIFPVEAHINSLDYQGLHVMIATIHDITARLRAEEDRLEMERRLLHAQKLESLGVLAGGIAHDFNNLLQAVLGNLELAALNLSPEGDAVENLEQARYAARHAAELTHQMLAYSGKGKFVIKRINLNVLVQENVQMLRSAISHKVVLDIDLAKDLPEIEADGAQLQQVVMNLITNGAESLADAPGLVTLRTGMGYYREDVLMASLLQDNPPAGHYVWLEVYDTGCGMDDETLDRLFEPFFSTKFTGRGLGMAAVQGIMQGHKGAIFVDSVIGQGTCVQVLFPALQHSVAEAPQAKLHSIGQNFTMLEALRAMDGAILAVDDEPMLLKVCEEFITRLDFGFYSASDGREAIDVYQAHADEICCIIMDVSMPTMDGISAFQELIQINPDVKVIMSSGFNAEEIFDQFNEVSPDGFVHKPYSFEEFQRQLWQTLFK